MATAKRIKPKTKVPLKKAPNKSKKSSKATKTTKKVVKKSTTIKTPIKKTSNKKALKKTKVDISDFSNFSSTFQPYKSKKNEKYMNASQKKHFENILQAWKNALHEEQEKTENLIQSDQGNFPDSVDRASKEEEFMLELRKRDRERKLISKIEQSMKDLSDNMYGFCDTCGIEIGIKRLEARPTATQCIDCKTIEEIKEKQQYG